MVKARRDLKCTYQVHRKRIYESAQICSLPTIPLKYKFKIIKPLWSDPPAVIQVCSNIGLSFETFGLNVRSFSTDSGQSE